MSGCTKRHVEANGLFSKFLRTRLINWAENFPEEVKATKARNYVGYCTWWRVSGDWHIDESCLAIVQGILTTAVDCTVGQCNSLLSVSLMYEPAVTWSVAVRLMPPPTPGHVIPCSFAEKPVTIRWTVRDHHVVTSQFLECLIRIFVFSKRLHFNNIKAIKVSSV
jgi:hypothetical protein